MRPYPRDAARALGISEAELVSTQPGARRLRGPFQSLVRALAGLSDVKTMTRNEHAVIERWGRFRDIEASDGCPLGQVVGEDIDLRIFFHHWHSCFLVEDELPSGPRTSLQVFDRQGDSVFKVFPESDDAKNALRALAAERIAGDEGPLTDPAGLPKPEPHRSLSIEKLGEFHAAWDSMKDTHEFFGLLRRFELPRVRALELAGRNRARQVKTSGFETVLERASKDERPIMIFVGSRGVLQIHTGPVRTIKRMAGYLNVLDPGFNLHVKDEAIARAFVVRKPTADGDVTSLELYDAANETVALLFSKRKPGQAEGADWRSLLASLGEVGA